MSVILIVTSTYAMKHLIDALFLLILKHPLNVRFLMAAARPAIHSVSIIRRRDEHDTIGEDKNSQKHAAGRVAVKISKKLAFELFNPKNSIIHSTT